MELNLNSNHTLPVLGLGTWKLTGDTAANIVEAAIKAGYRHLDCAMVYQNEAEVGRGIKAAIDQGIVKREDLFITSKLWNTDHAPVDVAKAIKSTLRNLGTDYLNLYLVHWGVAFEQGPELEPLDKRGIARFAPIPMADTWRAMEMLVEQDLVHSIGVANFTAPMLIDLMTYARIRPVVNQIELHPYHTQAELVAFCRAQGVAVTAYSPFGSTGASVLEDPEIKRLAQAYHKTPAQIALRWAIQRGTAAIPKTSSLERLTENLGALDFNLSDEDMASITALDQRKIMVDPIKWWGFPYFS